MAGLGRCTASQPANHGQLVSHIRASHHQLDLVPTRRLIGPFQHVLLVRITQLLITQLQVLLDPACEPAAQVTCFLLSVSTCCLLSPVLWPAHSVATLKGTGFAVMDTLRVLPGQRREESVQTQ